MSKIQLAALAAAMVVAIPVYAQDATTTQTTTTTTTVQTTPPSTVQVDEAKAQQQAADIVNNPDVHWTIKDRTQLLMEAPYIRPADLWELNHMFHMLPANEERVIFDAVTNSLRSNAGDYYQRRAMMDTYWQDRMNGKTYDMSNTTSSNMAAATSPYNDNTTRQQSMMGAGNAIGSGMDAIAAWELMLKDLDAQDRTTFRYIWNKMTSRQQDALINIVRQSSYYYTARNSGRFSYYYPY